MEFVFIPSKAKGDDKKFEGTLTLKVLSTPEKFRLMSKCQFEVGEDGVVKKNLSQLSAIADLIELTKQYILKVDLKKIDGSKEYKSVDDIYYAEECSEILIDTATQFLNGFKLGEG